MPFTIELSTIQTASAAVGFVGGVVSVAGSIAQYTQQSRLRTRVTQSLELLAILPQDARFGLLRNELNERAALDGERLGRELFMNVWKTLRSLGALAVGFAGVNFAIATAGPYLLDRMGVAVNEFIWTLIVGAVSLVVFLYFFGRVLARAMRRRDAATAILRGDLAAGPTLADKGVRVPQATEGDHAG